MEAKRAIGDLPKAIAVRISNRGMVLGFSGIPFWLGDAPLRIGLDLRAQLPVDWRFPLAKLLQDAEGGQHGALSVFGNNVRCEVSRTTAGYVVEMMQLEGDSFSLERVFRAHPVATLVFLDEEVQWASDQAIKLVGAPNFELLECVPFRQLFPKEASSAALLEASRDEQKESTLRDFQGRPHRVRVRAQREGTSTVVALAPATQELLAEEGHSERRLAGLGMLVAGVAHEINNPLTFVVPALKDAMKLAEGSVSGQGQVELVELLKDCVVGVERVAKIASDLREFKRGNDSVSRVDVNEVVVETLRLGNERLRGRVTLRHVLGFPAQVMANSTRLGQVILNLVLNAAQAMPDRKSEKSQVIVRSWLDDDFVKICVEDNGRGIPKDKLGAIFDPFFSTKNSGTGLGLSVCAGIVKRMGGWIEVDSEVGQGSIFTVVLRKCPDDPSLCPATSSLSARPMEGVHSTWPPYLSDSISPAESTVIRLAQEQTANPDQDKELHILVVDDEPLVLRSVKRMLGKKAVIVQASGGWEAIKLLQDGLEVEYVVSDMVMAEGAGQELWDWIKGNRADLRPRFAFMTGMAPSTRPDPDLPAIIHKPFSLEELVGVLDKKSNTT